MSAYYVIAIVIAVGAVALSATGLTRENFPPTPGAARALMVGTALLVLAGVVALLVTTDREHPREEAAEAAESQAQERGAEPGKAAEQGKAEQTARPEADRVAVTEDEFSISLEGGNELKPGSHTFAVANEGQIEHDFAIDREGSGTEPKTPLIDPGTTSDLKVDLKPGKYRFYCTVPGHAQSGMEVDVTVR